MPTPPPTILVVDDEHRAQVLLRSLLEAEGYRVVCAGNGAETLALASAERPDLILLDLMMPGMDGYEVCRRLRGDEALAAVPVIMLTALDDRASKLKGIEAGADDFLSKPFDSTELRARVRTITRLNRAQKLYEQRAQAEAAVAFAPDGIVLAKITGEIVQRNAAFDKLLPEAATATNLFTLLPAPVREKVDVFLAGHVLSALPPIETPLVGGGDREVTVEISASLMPWRGRTMALYHLRDLTEKKALETQLLRSQRIELLGQLAGSIVHDVNNVLTAIGASADFIAFDPGRDHTELLGHIQTGVQRGASMLRQLLMFARGSDGEMVPVDPRAIAREVAALVGESFGASYQLSLQADDGGVAVIEGDPTQVHQILMNLCVNARDAMPDGGGIEISFARKEIDAAAAAREGSHVQPGNYFALSVRDQGTGIPPEVIPRLFEPFFTTKPAGKGTGLGLATVMRLVRRHRGFVTLQSTVGQGTCFTCHFPELVTRPALG
jgi:two-component system cell cycle sensor histidine kinase/response regulator CckA